jgi:two-component system sensor histidine kinase BaeS
VSGIHVPWYRSLFVRVFGTAAIIAILAVFAATWAATAWASFSVHEEQQNSLRVNTRAYVDLVSYGATHRSWAGARGLLLDLQRESRLEVTVTDLSGVPLVSSSSQALRREPAQAIGTLDPLNIDATLLIVSDPQPSPSPTACVSVAPCIHFTVAAPAVVSPLAVRNFAAVSGSSGWLAVEAQVNACLRQAQLDPVSSVLPDFSAIVTYGHDHATVARCLSQARAAALTPFVAGPALLFVGAPSSGDATLSWNPSSRGWAEIAILACVVLAVMLALCALLARGVVKPLRDLASAALGASGRDLGARVPYRRRDEIAEVARAFNLMADRREQLEAARTSLINDVSHELRTPMSNVRGWLEAAQDGLVDTDDELVSSLLEETVHLQQLVDDLHDLALSDAGELHITLEEVDIRSFLARIALAFRGPAEYADVTVLVEAEADVVVNVDPLRLRQAVSNLVANALSHTPAGGRITIRGGAESVEVSDSGAGIDAAELPFVFDRFRRADPSRSRATGGSGLGLAIVRQIAEAHGGHATISSVVGSGTTVTIRFSSLHGGTVAS